MFNVAIDGPSGAGKSSICTEAAKRLGFVHVDTGALYRSIAYTVIKNNADISDEISLRQLLDSTKIELRFENNEQCVILNGENINDKIRTEEVSLKASDVSKIPMVREFLLDLQRELAANGNVLMDGRDIGTIVLPNADVKIFLTASPEKRAERRYNQLLEKGEEAEYNTVLDKLIKRDYQDSHREIAPLKPSEDSIIADTSELDFEQSVKKIIEIIEEKL